MKNFDQALSEIEIFRTLSDAERVSIARQCTWRHVDRQKQIIGHLDPTNDIFFVVQGTARVVNYSVSGKQVSFRDIKAGEMFGEYSAIDDIPRSATVFALTDAFIGSLSSTTFLAIIERHPTIALAALRMLTSQVRHLTDRVFEFSTLAVNNRIDAELQRLAVAAGVHDNVAEITLAPTHAEIASRVSTQREAVTREINSLARDGIVEKVDKTLVIKDFARLRDLVSLTLGEFSPASDC